MNKTELGKEILAKSYLRGRFLLRSGDYSDEYFDKYRFESEPYLLRSIAEHLSGLLPTDFDLFAGLEMGGIPLATALSLHTNKPVVFVRKTAKSYGTCKIAEGLDLEGRRVVLIEDVVTSGGQIILSANDLINEGAKIVCAICVIDRGAGGKERLAENSIALYSLFTMNELKSL